MQRADRSSVFLCVAFKAVLTICSYTSQLSEDIQLSHLRSSGAISMFIIDNFST